jgi:hypothetical protein
VSGGRVETYQIRTAQAVARSSNADTRVNDQVIPVAERAMSRAIAAVIASR